MSLLEKYEQAASEWLDRVAAVAPVIEQHREAIEAERRLPEPVFEAMRDAGLFRMWLPKQYGGCEVGLVTCRLVFEAVARLDGSAGWCVGILNEAAGIAAYLPEAGAREIFVSSNVIAAGSGFPPGQAERVDGGYLVSGTWPLASGSPHAQWFWAAATMTGEDGNPQMRAVVMQSSECRILDSWYSTGLRGSGSHHIQAEKVFVPDHRLARVDAPPRIAHSIYPHQYVRVLSPNHAAVGLGVALGALDAFKELARTKPGSRGNPPLGEQQIIHALVGRSEIRLRAAHLAVLDASAATQAQLDAEGNISMERFMLNRLAGAHVAAEATAVVSDLYTAAGSNSVYQSSRLDRALRDVHTVNQHLSAGPANFALAGRFLLSGE
jgi:alkylation response protein AidB-like acyl-CoA dehydrogenase